MTARRPVHEAITGVDGRHCGSSRYWRRNYPGPDYVFASGATFSLARLRAARRNSMAEGWMFFRNKIWIERISSQESEVEAFAYTSVRAVEAEQYSGANTCGPLLYSPRVSTGSGKERHSSSNNQEWRRVSSNRALQGGVSTRRCRCGPPHGGYNSNTWRHAMQRARSLTCPKAAQVRFQAFCRARLAAAGSGSVVSRSRTKTQFQQGFSIRCGVVLPIEHPSEVKYGETSNN